MTDSYLYDSFGNILLTTVTTTNWFRYVGRLGYYLNSDPGTYYLRARIFDPSIGRFISNHPMGFSAGDVNLYRYVGNRPTGLVDPSGHRISCYGISGSFFSVLAARARYSGVTITAGILLPS